MGNHIAVTGDRGRGAPRTSLTTWTGVVLDPAGWCPRSWDGLPAGASGGAGGGADTVRGRVTVRLTFSLAEVLSESPLESGSFVPSAPCSGRKSLCTHTSEWGLTSPHCTHFRAPAGSASLLPRVYLLGSARPCGICLILWVITQGSVALGLALSPQQLPSSWGVCKPFLTAGLW